MKVRIGLGLANFPFSDSRAFWRYVERCEDSTVDSLWQSDRLTCRGFVREIIDEGPKRRAHLDVWAEKEDGTKVTIGTASALLD
mgnify:CR=1 FL=1